MEPVPRSPAGPAGIAFRQDHPTHYRAMANRLVRRLRSGKAQVGVVGLGYVGLPLAVAFARAGLGTVGFDVDRERTDAFGRAESYILDVPAEEVRAAVESGALAATADFAGLARVDAIVICVPTPLGKAGDPDLSHVTAAVDHVAARLLAGQLVVLESTTYPRRAGRGGPPTVRGGRPAGRRRLPPGPFTGTDRPRPPRPNRTEHPEGSRRRRRGIDRGGRRPLRPDRRYGRPGLFAEHG